jgi:hypothetical protein
LERNIEGGLFTTDCERWIKGVLEVERLTLRGFCDGKMKVGNPLLGTLEGMQKRLWNCVISIGALLEKLEGGSFIRDCER